MKAKSQSNGEPMKHIQEDDLILHFYGDLDASATVEANAHLKECSDCRAEFAYLSEVLSAVNDETLPLPQRGEFYGAQVWARISPRLDPQKQSFWQLWLAPKRLAIIGSCAALLFIAFMLGRISTPLPNNDMSAKQSHDRVLLVAVGQHLEKSQMVLMEISNAEPSQGPVDISYEQKQARDLLTANRLYRQSSMTVDKATAPAVPVVLDELERVLLQIANSPSQIDSSDLAHIQKSIESQGLLFKVRVVENKVKTSTANHKPNPAPVNNRAVEHKL
jgi:hypothetical protein